MGPNTALILLSANPAVNDGFWLGRFRAPSRSWLEPERAPYLAGAGLGLAGAAMPATAAGLESGAARSTSESWRNFPFPNKSSSTLSPTAWRLMASDRASGVQKGAPFTATTTSAS